MDLGAKAVTEFVGTFFLILVIITAVAAAPPGFAPIAIGSVLMVMIYAGGHISGAHYNPAVTLAAVIRGACPVNEAPVYVIAQLVGGCLAGLVGNLLVELDPAIIAKATEASAGLPVSKAILGEALGTFALCYVVLNVATAKANEGNSHYGLAIGFTVTACAYGLGGFSGGAFNPAVAVGAGIGNLFSWSIVPVVIGGNLIGAVLAALVFKFASRADAAEPS